ncbi:MAG: antibiotic biosynthesis monooxygenase [Anaerolineales bacterium]
MNTWLTAIHIKSEFVENFLEASTPFAGESLRESGLVSFALLQQVTDASSFSMFYVYHDDAAREAHLNSSHYLTWLTIITPLLSQPIVSLPYNPIFPPPEDWEHHLETES